MQKFRNKQGIEHGMIEVIANSIPDHGYKNLNEKNRKEMLERMKKDLQPVKRMYQNLKNQDTGKFEGWYGSHPGEPLRSYRFLNGEVYTIPRGLSKKINDLGAPIRSGLIDETGKQYEMDGRKDRTHQMVAVGE